MAQKVPPQAESLSGVPQPNFTGYEVPTVKAKRAPTALDVGYRVGQGWVDTVGGNAYTLIGVSAGSANWAITGGSSASGVNTINSLPPTSGNINIVGTSNQSAVSNAGSTVTLGLPAAVIAPGSLSSVGAATLGTTGSNANTIGNITGTTSVGISSGSGGINLTGNNASITLSAGTGAIQIATDNSNSGVNVGTGAGAKTVVVGSTNTTSTTTVQAGSGLVHLSGNILQPTNSAFFFFLSSSVTNATGNGASYQLGSTVALTSLYNRGGNMAANGTYTAPVTGIYDFRVAFAVSDTTVATTFLASLTVGAGDTFLYNLGRTAGSENTSIGLSVIILLNAAQTVTTSVRVLGEAGNTDTITGSGSPYETYFCGKLVG